jgi:hypothetical protein
VEKCLIRLLLPYTSQNLLGTIFRVTFTVFYRRIWNIVGKYSILCCDKILEFKMNQPVGKEWMVYFLEFQCTFECVECPYEFPAEVLLEH